MSANDRSSLNEDTRKIWDANAAWWDEYVGVEGNDFHRTLVAPAQNRLLALKRGERVVDVACGNGQFAREMAQAGVAVVAFDFAASFIELAKQHSEAAGITNIDYRVIDATVREELLSLGAGRFDAAVCTMALMDIAIIEPLVEGLVTLLKPGGRFVFSVTHPCFNSGGTRMLAEEEDRDGELVRTHSIRVMSYLDPPPRRGVGIAGQPESHYYFDRTISELLDTCFRAGFVLDGIEEPAHPEAGPAKRGLGWSNYTQIPPVLVARLRSPA